jgi:hypothetical protein
MGVTNFPNGVSSFGIPVVGSGNIPVCTGDYIWVNPDHPNASDDTVGKRGRRSDQPFNTVAAAYSGMTSNAGDCMLLSYRSSHTLSAMLSVSGNRHTFHGLGPARKYGQGCKVSLGVTTAATDIGTISVTGVRNSFSNIKFINNNTVAEGIYCFVDGGEYTLLNNCEIYKSTDMDVTGAAELVANGDSSQYFNCTIGSLATARSGAVIRPAVLFTKATAAAGKVARDNLFQGCNFWINASNTANRYMYGANATDIERVCEITDCNFINNGASSATPAQNIAFGATLTVGHVLVRGGMTNSATAVSTTTGVFVQGAVPTAATSLIAVQAA